VAGGFCVQGQAEIHRKTLSPKTKREREIRKSNINQSSVAI
jgi:hypothetical protein